jgi:hypothetical protein
MKRLIDPLLWLVLAAIGLLSGCASKPYDYTNYRAYPPRSILVLPPLNNTTDMGATYGYLSTVSFPIGERGYYIFPVAVVDQVMKENGLPTAGEMQQVSLQKIHDIIGADAVLYTTVTQYGSKYQVLSSTTEVAAEAKLVDVKTGTVLWAGKVKMAQGTSSGNPIVDLIATPIEQAINQSTDQAHGMCAGANATLFNTKDQGLLTGPYYPQDQKQ